MDEAWIPSRFEMTSSYTARGAPDGIVSRHVLQLRRVNTQRVVLILGLALRHSMIACE